MWQARAIDQFSSAHHFIESINHPQQGRIEHVPYLDLDALRQAAPEGLGHTAGDGGLGVGIGAEGDGELELGVPRAFPFAVCVAWTAELELGVPRAFPVVVCVAWTAELELGGPRAFPVIACVARNAELELGGPRVGRPRAFPVVVCVAWTAELGLGVLDVFAGVGTQSERLTRKAEFETLAAGARPSPHERNRGI
jgi:hypothetical protein